MKVRLAADLQSDSIVDGDGIRTVIWFQGCSHKCEGCHNPETHDFFGGHEYELDDILDQIKELEYQDGITLSGGDPFFQSEAATKIAKYAKELGLNVWAYTGFLFDDILKNKKMKELLENIDVLIDGRFEIDKKSLNCKYRGSTNQRIIDVKKSLEDGSIVLYYED